MKVGQFFLLLICNGLAWRRLLGEVMISESFNCFAGTPSFVQVDGVLSRRECSFACIVRKCLFFRYEGQNCYIDNSASDVHNGGIVGRNFVSFDVNYLGYDKPMAASSIYDEDEYYDPPRHAVDKSLETISHTYGGVHEWLILDLLRSFAIENIVVTIRPDQAVRFNNITVFLSSELNFDNYFLNGNMIIFAHQTPVPSSTVITLTPEDGSSFKCGRYLTISKHTSLDLEEDSRILEMVDVKPMILNQGLFDVAL